MSKKQLLALTLGSQSLSALFNLLTALFLALLLGAEDFGVIQLFTAYVGVVALLGGLSNPAVIHVMNRSERSPAQVALNSLALALVAGGLAYAAGTFVFVRLFPAVPGVVGDREFFIFSLSAVVIGLANSLAASNLASGGTRSYNLMTVSSSAVWFVFVVLASFTEGLTVALALTGFWLGSLVRLVVGVMALRNFWSWTGIGLELELLVELGKEGSKVYLANALNLLNHRVGIFLVGYLAGTREVGFYAVAVRIADQLGLLSQAVSVVLLGAVAKTDKEMFPRLVARAARHSLAGTALLAILVALLVPFLLPLILGFSYGRSIPPLLILLPGVIVRSVTRCVSAGHVGLGRLSLPAITGVATLILSSGLSVLFIPWFGIVGAAGAASVASIAAFGIQTGCFVVFFRQRLADVLFLKPAEFRDAWRALPGSFHRTFASKARSS